MVPALHGTRCEGMRAFSLLHLHQTEECSKQYRAFHRRRNQTAPVGSTEGLLVQVSILPSPSHVRLTDLYEPRRSNWHIGSSSKESTPKFCPALSNAFPASKTRLTSTSPLALTGVTSRPPLTAPFTASSRRIWLSRSKPPRHRLAMLLWASTRHGFVFGRITLAPGISKISILDWRQISSTTPRREARLRMSH